MKYTVYKHTNKITNKSYIGFTKHSIFERWQGHIHAYKFCKKAKMSKFYNALKKYGIDDTIWTHEILEELNTILFAKASEIFWIDFFNTFKKGYNSTIGGDGTIGLKFSQESCEKISKNKSCQIQTQDTCIKRSVTLKKSNKVRRRKVQQFDKNGVFLCEYNSLGEAAKLNNTYDTLISKCCCGIRRFAGGFQWKYSDNNIISKPISTRNKQNFSKINQYTLDDEFIKTFESYSDIKQYYSFKNIDNIRKVCKEIRISAYGFKWKYF